MSCLVCGMYVLYSVGEGGTGFLLWASFKEKECGRRGLTYVGRCVASSRVVLMLFRKGVMLFLLCLWFDLEG